MSLRSAHYTAAIKQVEDADSLVELARLEVGEGADPRKSVSEAISLRAGQLVRSGVSDDDQLAVIDIVSSLDDSLVLAALEGDSQDDDGTGPGETQEGGESLSVAGTSAPDDVTVELPTGKPRPPVQARASERPVGRLVRVRQDDGTVLVMGLGNLRAKRGG